MPPVAKKSNQLTNVTETLPPNGETHTSLLTLDTFKTYLAQLARDVGGNAELARRLGVTGQFVDMLIAGKRRPGPKMLAAIGARRVVMIEIDVEEANGQIA
jgi:hypothetical protein